MSMEIPIELQYPHCNMSQTTMIWQSINSTLSPHAKQDLLKGEINIFSCSECNNPIVIDTQLLYHDMEKKFTVQYYLSRLLEREDFLDEFTPNAEIDVPVGLLQDSPDTAYLRKPHIVFSIQEMITYIIFRDRLFEKKKRRDLTSRLLKLIKVLLLS